jgi:haloacid dehalogenase superfamily, subfamily IA, variant 3 with third motif having DD or ED/haloacid dehalogenase superfamily, subfamily IA, variant 1 with third motif having Dx(3-4)D or Dx(3-4)E
MATLLAGGRAYDVDGILFDKDGTLLDFLALWGTWADCLYGGLRAGLAARGVDWRLEEWTGLLGTFHAADGTMTGFDRGGPFAMGSIDDVTAILAGQAYRRGLPWNEALELVRICRKQADAELDRMRPVRALPGLHRFLEQCALRGLPLAVVTADDTQEARKHLDWLGIDRYFADIIGNDRVSRGKPDPEMVRLACASLGIEPSRTALIGDTAGDMQMGKAAGVRLTIGIGASDGLPGADVVISDYDALTILPSAEA